MVDAGAVEELSGMSLGETGGADAPVDMFAVATSVIREATLELSDSEVIAADHPNCWDFLYSLHASRGSWREAAAAMDGYGRALAGAVASLSDSVRLDLSEGRSRKVLDDISLAASACLNALRLVDPSRRYLIHRKGSGAANELLREEDAASRALRASALRMFALDDRAPGSVAELLSSST